MNEKTTQSKDSNNVPESVLLFAGKLGGFSLLLIIPLLVLLFSFDFISSYSSSSTNKSSSSSSSRKSENTDYEKKVCQDPYGNWHSHISTCTTCGTSYCVEYLQYGKYCSQGCCAAYEGISSKCGY